MSANSHDKEVPNQYVWRMFYSHVADFVIVDQSFNVNTIIQMEAKYNKKANNSKMNMDVFDDVGFKVVQSNY